jgi:hypothetical protein
MFHLTINGRPLCQHAACIAGMQDLEAVRGKPTCAQGDERGATQAAAAWKAAHPRHAVEIVNGPCPADVENASPTQEDIRAALREAAQHIQRARSVLQLAIIDETDNHPFSDFLEEIDAGIVADLMDAERLSERLLARV